MTLGPAFRAGYRTLLARPTEVLPFYVIALGVPLVAQTVGVVGLALTYWIAASGGHLAPVRSELEAVAPVHLDDPQQAGAVPVDALAQAFADAMTPAIAAVLLGTMLLALLGVAVAYAIVGAGRLHAAYAAVSGRPATRAGVAGVARHWTTFVALLVLEVLAYVVVFLALGLAVALLGAVSAVLALLGQLVAVLVGGVLAVLVRLAFAFARPAAVVDDAGALGAVRGGYRHVVGRPWESLGYLLFALVAFAAAAFVASPFSAIGAGSVGSVVTSLAVLPLLDLVKTILYADASDASLAVPKPRDDALASRVRRTIGAGLGELASFARGHVGALAASTALFAGGLALGVVLGGRVDHLFVASIEARLGDVSPVGSFFEYAANNWSVGAAQSFGGLLFGVPTLVGLLFNGTLIGAFYQLDADPELLLAFVAPHGLLEIPGLLLSGALGLHLGAVALRSATGSIDRAALADEIDRAFAVVLGLIAVFVGAAVIEAFVSPYYWRFLGI